jgi:hypothetical protein
MSDQQAAKPGGSNLHRNPWVTALRILGGVILLLPGLCSLIFFVIWIRSAPGYHSADYDSVALLIMLAGFAIGAAGGGIALIVFAIRR